MSRHRHPGPVFGYVIKGHWHYLEHDFIASPGKFLFEPPGETHTLVVDSDDEMITLFNVMALWSTWMKWRNGGYEDVFTKIEMCMKHYEQVGLGKDL